MHNSTEQTGNQKESNSKKNTIFDKLIAAGNQLILKLNPYEAFMPKIKECLVRSEIDVDFNDLYLKVEFMNGQAPALIKAIDINDLSIKIFGAGLVSKQELIKSIKLN